MLKPIIIASALMGLTSLINSARAADFDPPSEAVSYAGLDLTKDEGRALLQRKLKQASKKVCGEAYSRDFSAQNRVAKCRKNTLSEARRDAALAISQAERHVGQPQKLATK